MFESATLKLTGWYLLILMTISLVFSAAIYKITSDELNTRLERFSDRLQQVPSQMFQPNEKFGTLRSSQEAEAATNLMVSLVYANLIVLVGGGIGSYLLARRTIAPIEAAHEAQSRFTSDASHELRTPLAAMKAELEVTLMDKHASKDEMREVLTSNLEEVEKLSSLSEMLLNLSRLDGKGLDKTSIDLSETVESSIRRLSERGKRITSHSSKAVKAYGNQAAIEEVVLILIDNALKYSPADSPIEVRVYRHNRQAYFEIKNEGKGISEEHMPHIFERFYRADSSRTSQDPRKGYGLGLSLAKKIMEIHHGDILVESIPDKTTTFTVQLPVAKSTSQISA